MNKIINGEMATIAQDIVVRCGWANVDTKLVSKVKIAAKIGMMKYGSGCAKLTHKKCPVFKASAGRWLDTKQTGMAFESLMASSP